MISYVLVLIISLATGRVTNAVVQGPMSDSWCQQLIQQAGYSGQDGMTLRTAACLRGPDAELQLVQNFCRQTSEPSQRTRRQFVCVAPSQASPAAPMPAVATMGVPAPRSAPTF